MQLQRVSPDEVTSYLQKIAFISFIQNAMGADYIKLPCFLTEGVILQNSNVFCLNSLTLSSLSLKFFGASPQGGASLQAILLLRLDDAFVFGKHFIMKCHSS